MSGVEKSFRTSWKCFTHPCKAENVDDMQLFYDLLTTNIISSSLLGRNKKLNGPLVGPRAEVCPWLLHTLTQSAKSRLTFFVCDDNRACYATDSTAGTPVTAKQKPKDFKHACKL